jgi:FlaA1/EpsC-like NDP-sugar epimerase
MIELSGLVVKDEEHPDGDIEIKVTGLRPGEKLYEELLIGANPQSTTHPRIMKAHEAFLPWDTLAQKLLELGHAVDGNDVEAIRDILRELVTGYVAPEDFVDLIYARVNS